MHHWRNKTKTRLLGPRALAIVSCALALLAAQPVGHANVRTTPTAIRAASHAANESMPILAMRTTQRQSSRQEIMGAPSRWSGVHVLATVEILKRLLIAELRSPSQQCVLPLMNFEPLALAPFESPSVFCVACLTLPHSPPAAYEREFSITHQLLAPPLA